MKRILAIILLLIFIGGQVNLTWATHFCGQLAVESTVSIGKDFLSCGMEGVTCCDEDFDENYEARIISDTCCSNDYYSSDSDDFFLKSESENAKQIQFTTTFISSIFKLYHQIEHHSFTIHEFANLITPEKQVLYQIFLL